VVDVLNLFRGGENDDRKNADTGLPPDPSEDLKAVHAEHFKIEQNEVRQRVLHAVGVAPAAVEILDGLLAAADPM